MSDLTWDPSSEYQFLDSFKITNITYETAQDAIDIPKNISTYCMYLITEGEGILHTHSKQKRLMPGDIIITPPATTYTITGNKLLRYMRINYSGTEAQIISKQFGTVNLLQVYSGFKHLKDMWLSCLNLPYKLAILRCKAIVYYTLSEIGKDLPNGIMASVENSTAQKIRSFIDDNFTLAEINLNFISKQLSYHPNYISMIFNAEFGISIVKYINILRIQHACYLMDQGMTTLKTIAPLCGYDNVDYFSSVFKEQMGITPKMYIKRLSTDGTTA